MTGASRSGVRQFRSLIGTAVVVDSAGGLRIDPEPHWHHSCGRQCWRSTNGAGAQMSPPFSAGGLRTRAGAQTGIQLGNVRTEPEPRSGIQLALHGQSRSLVGGPRGFVTQCWRCTDSASEFDCVPQCWRRTARNPHYNSIVLLGLSQISAPTVSATFICLFDCNIL